MKFDLKLQKIERSGMAERGEKKTGKDEMLDEIAAVVQLYLSSLKVLHHFRGIFLCQSESKPESY